MRWALPRLRGSGEDARRTCPETRQNTWGSLPPSSRARPSREGAVGRDWCARVASDPVLGAGGVCTPGGARREYTWPAPRCHREGARPGGLGWRGGRCHLSPSHYVPDPSLSRAGLKSPLPWSESERPGLVRLAVAADRSWDWFHVESYFASGPLVA